MNEKRLLNIDILRALATLWVLSYHIWVYCQYPNLGYTSLIAYGGEIGVTLFFMISGFSIFLSLRKFEYKNYLTSRLKRILPGYLLCIFIIITFTYFSYDSINRAVLDITLHLFFIHNLFVFSHGSINGVFWTLGVTMQFYLIAPFMYRFLQKKPFIILISSILVSLVYKFLVYKFIEEYNFDSIYYFIYGRQLFGCLDSFITGMFLAYVYKYKFSFDFFIKYKKILLIVGFMGGSILVLSLKNSPLYSFSLFSISWHTMFTFCLLVTLSGFLYFKINPDNVFINVLLKISTIEYGIYLWHLPILLKFNQVIECTPIIKFYLLIVLVTLFTILTVNIFKSVEVEIKKKINFLIEDKVKFFRFLYGFKKYIKYEFLYFFKKKNEKIFYKEDNEKYILFISHTNPYIAIGGVEKRILEEMEYHMEKGRNVIHVSPLRLNALPQTRNNIYCVIINKNNLGYFKIKEIVEFLNDKSIETFHIHHLLFWSFKDLKSLINMTKKEIIFHIHDLFYLFPENYVKEFSALIPLNKSKFNEVVKQIFFDIDELVFPSEYCYYIYKEHYDISQIKNILIPHLKLENEKKIQKKKNLKTRIAFIGYKNEEKGFHIWQSIINEDFVTEFNLFHFSNASPYSDNVKVINYSTQENGIDALTQRLIYYNIDYVLLLSTIPETFSYVLYECIAAGTKILCLNNSGNIATMVKKNNYGIVFDNIQDLKDFLKNEYSSNYDYPLERITYDLIINYEPLCTWEE